MKNNEQYIEDTDTLSKKITSLLAKDNFSKETGVKLKTVTQNSITTYMKVTSVMLNGFNICHGGAIFTLADSTLAFLCNKNAFISLSIRCDINYHAPAYANDILYATAEAIYEHSKIRLYKVAISNQKNQLIASFTGNSYQTSKKFNT